MDLNKVIKFTESFGLPKKTDVHECLPETVIISFVPLSLEVRSSVHIIEIFANRSLLLRST